jgi:hypothetical protein
LLVNILDLTSGYNLSRLEKRFTAPKDLPGFRLLLQAANKKIYAINKAILMIDKNSDAVIFFLVRVVKPLMA